ncbi:MAG: ATP-binding protein [Christensenellales bacterium]|jgi:serine/threonine-protein kinase RsbT|nr:anti-sigma regulatory factor [Christensenellaceae bacterium]
MIAESFSVEKGDYLRAGEASTKMKNMLKKLGIGGSVLRRISVAAYEVEMNLVIHSLGGTLSIDLDGDYIWLVSEDIGPGIPDIESAMREGYSTADEIAQGMGFGAGMGIPNMKRNADVFEIESEPNKGTKIKMGFLMGGGKSE